MRFVGAARVLRPPFSCEIHVTPLDQTFEDRRSSRDPPSRDSYTPPRINNESSFWGCYDFVTRVRGVLRFLSRRLEGGGGPEICHDEIRNLYPPHIIVEHPLGVAKNDVSLREF